MKKVSKWKRFFVFVIDLVASYWILGMIIGYFTDQLVSEGVLFELHDGSAILLILLVIAYFIIMNKYCGGTLAKRLFGIKQKKAK